MKQIVLPALGAVFLAWAAPVDAGTIQRACNASDRSAATPQVCSCIQKVANKSLNASEQRRVSKFFRDPHLAQEVRMSDSRSDEAFWKRYKAFGERARKTCG